MPVQPKRWGWLDRSDDVISRCAADTNVELLRERSSGPLATKFEPSEQQIGN